MKTISKILIIAACLIYLFGCQKDEQPHKEPEYQIEMNDNAGDIDTRSGGHQFVFFSQSMTITHTLLNLYPQYVFNRGLTDSIVLIKVLPEIDAEINPGVTSGRYCYLYTAVIYQRDIFPMQVIVYAPATFGNRATFIPAGTPWNNNIAYAEIQRNNNVYQEYFDLSCQSDRRNYAYRINYVTTDTSYTQMNVLTGNNGCSDLYRVKMSW